MPFPQLVSSVIEQGINTLLNLDPKSATRFSRLSGKHIRLKLTEMPFALRFCFADSVLVLTDSVETNDSLDVSIQVSLWALDKMKDSSQLTRMIKQDQLQLEGDMAVAQQFSALFDELSIDWEELLSRKIGDVAAYNLFSLGKRVHQHALETTSKLQRMFKDAALEEKRIAAHPLLVEEFIDDVHQLDAQVERLNQRIKRLEN